MSPCANNINNYNCRKKDLQNNKQKINLKEIS